MKRFLAMLLAVVMVVSVLPVGTIAESVGGTPEPQAEQTTAEKHTKYSVQPSHAHVENDAHICEHCVAAGAADTMPTWTPWGDDAAEKTKLPTAAGHYYITEDLSNMVTTDLSSSSADVVICLNGKTLSAKQGSATQRFYSLGTNAKVTILDCTAHEENGSYVAGKFTGATYATFWFAHKAANKAVLTIYDGIITNSTKIESTGVKNGGAISMQGPCTVNLYGGEISNCRANNGGAIHLQNRGATLNIDGAVIKNNTAISSGSAIFNNEEQYAGTGNNTIIIKNATITGNKTESAGEAGCGAIYLNYQIQTGGLLTFGGNCQITGNTDSSGAEYNLFLQNNAGEQVTFAVDGLSSDARIGVRVAADRLSATDGLTVSKALSGANVAANFVVDNANYKLETKDDVLVLVRDAGHIHNVCNDPACEEGHADVTYLPWGNNESEKTSLPTSGNYYLTNDVTLSAQVSVNGNTLNLCLNGHTVKIKDGVTARHFWVKSSGKLNISNCSTTEGIITGGKSSAIMTENAGACAIELYNVVFEGNCYTGGGGGALMLQGSTTLKAVSCVFRNNTGSSSGGALRVYNNSSATLIGCEFKNNSAASMGAIRQDGGTLTLIDTVIEDNRATTTGEYNYGAVYVANGSGTFTVQGKTRIINNKNGDSDPSNVWFQNTANNQAVITVGEEGLSGDALIGITLQKSRLSATDGRVVTAKLGGKDVAAFFQYDTSEFETVIKDDVVIVEEVSTHVHNLCNDTDCGEHAQLKFKDWDTATELPREGAYCLQTNVELSSGAYVAGDLKLCLNGYTITFQEGSKISFYMKDGATLSITDCKDTGKITGGERNYGGVINVSQGATFNLYGGTLTGNKTADMDNDKGKGGAVYLSKAGDSLPGGVFNMYGGTISGNTAYRGGAVYLCNGATFNLYGGTIASNTATYRGGAITNDGVATINISGGTITGNTAKNGAAVYLCGGSTMTMTGGEITSNTSESAGGAILMESAGTKLILEGGKISGNTTSSDGGAIYASVGTVFEMIGGTISGNTANNGGGLYLNKATATISGGSIQDNEATGDGGAIAILQANTVLADAQITGNTAETSGGGVWVDTDTIQLSGDLVIQDNQAAGKSSNLYLSGEALFTIDTMGDDAQVGISAERVYGAMSAKTDKDCSAAFTSDNSALKIIYKDQTVYLEAIEGHAHCLCNDQSTACRHEAVSFIPWSDATALPRSGNYYLTGDVQLSVAAYVASDLKLCLNGHTITVNGTDRIFNMRAGATLSITDCKGTGKITGGVHNYGGIINVSQGSTFNLYGGSLTGNKTVDMDNDRGKGGAVYLSKASDGQPGGVFNMYGGVITGNTAYRGGGIYLCDGSTFNLYNGTLSGNTATYRGGAISNDGVATISISGGIITGNTAKNGAAVYLCGGANMTIAGGQITKNASTSAGGVILVESKGTKLVLKDGLISGNSTTSDGTIYASKNTILEMSGGTIMGNKAKNGGGIYVNEATATISGGSIKNNVTTGSGGGVYFLKPVEGLISGGSITGNRAESYGAGVYVYDGSAATISGGNISYNTAVKGAGGGVCLMGGTLNLKGGTIGYNENLSKSNKGGGIMMYGGTLTMTGGHIVGNKVQENVSGAGICCTTISKTRNGVRTDYYSKITMYGGTISDHVGNYGGAVILQSKTTFNMYGGTFRNNEAKGDGGAIYLNGGSVFNMYGGSMIDNKAANRGGAICYFANTSGEITACNASGNSAGGYGGFLAAHGIDTKVTIKDLKITGHESKSYGGAISITWNASMDMDNCEFYENKAVKGGAMYLAHKTTCNLTNVKVYRNTASEMGGGFYLDVGNNIRFTNVKVLDNQATGNGGGIYTRANLYLKDCLIDSNTSDANGGGIATGGAFTYGNLPEHTAGYVGRGQGLVIDNTMVTNNTCVGSGGGVHMAKQNWNTIIDSQFTGNISGENGSALFIGDDLTIKGGMTVTGNTSKNDGYAVYFSENSYDGQSHVLTVHEIGGNVIVKDNEGGEVMLCKDVALGTTTEGYGKDTYFTITLADGLLTNWVLGAYNYDGGDLNYTVTYGTRSLDEPEVAPKAAETDTALDGNVWLYAGVGVFAAAVIAAVVLLLVKKKKAGKPAETTQE